MLYLANPCGPDVVTAMKAGAIGLIDTPRQRNTTQTDDLHTADVPWCADNGCFSDRWDQTKWWQFLVNNSSRASTCLFAVAPDVVGDAAATEARSRPWLKAIRALGYPVAYVAQDGLEDLAVPWDDIDVLFIGGTTEWKLGRHAVELAHQAKQHGKRVHCGRVNSERRYQFAAAPYPYGLGADSADGTFLTFGPIQNLPRLLGWTRSSGQLDLFGGDR